MNIRNARPIILYVEIPLPDDWDEFVLEYAGIELDGILYLMDPRDNSDYVEPKAYYTVATKDIPDYDFDDDINSMIAKHSLSPVSIDNEEIRDAVKEASKIMVTRYKR